MNEWGQALDGGEAGRRNKIYPPGPCNGGASEGKTHPAPPLNECSYTALEALSCNALPPNCVIVKPQRYQPTLFHPVTNTISIFNNKELYI